DLLAFLRRMAPAPPRSAAKPKKPAEAAMLAGGETRALQELRRTDPDKYQILKRFETRIREGSILTTLDEFRAFGEVLDKGFAPGKSRKEALGRLMALLALMDRETLETAVAKVPASAARDDDSYRRLANHIISGGQGHSAEPHPVVERGR